MYKQARALGTALVAVACAACAKSSAGPTMALTPAEAIWTGQLQPTEQNSGQAAASRRTMIDGRVEMVADKDFPDRTRIDVTIGTPNRNSSVTWALVPDRCGTGGVPVLPSSAFSPIEVGPSGRGEVAVTLPLELPTQGSYHVDIYEGRSATLAAVQACAELKMHAK